VVLVDLLLKIDFRKGHHLICGGQQNDRCHDGEEEKEAEGSAGDLRGHHDATDMCQSRRHVCWDLGAKENYGDSSSCRSLDTDGLEGPPSRRSWVLQGSGMGVSASVPTLELVHRVRHTIVWADARVLQRSRPQSTSMKGRPRGCRITPGDLGQTRI
jgi:hypothetical protein